MRALLPLLVACGSSAPPPAPAPRAVEVARPVAHDPGEAERLRRAELAKAHHKLEAQQSEALAATCADPKAPAPPRCLPSCYATEAPDPRADKRPKALVEIGHLVCERDGKYLVVDELGTNLPYRPGKRPPRAPKRGSWQAEVAGALALKDPIAITGAWRDVVHPLTQEKLRCVTASRFVKRGAALGPCGGLGTCEAAGNPTARAINVVHYRVAEAKRLQAAGKPDDCQAAALEAVAVSRGLPRWRQYVSLNVGKWKEGLAYRTRFDGVLDEETLFATVAALGSEAERIHQACGGGNAAPTVEQEQSFHTCW